MGDLRSPETFAVDYVFPDFGAYGNPHAGSKRFLIMATNFETLQLMITMMLRKSSLVADDD